MVAPRWGTLDRFAAFLRAGVNGPCYNWYGFEVVVLNHAAYDGMDLGSDGIG